MIIVGAWLSALSGGVGLAAAPSPVVPEQSSTNVVPVLTNAAQILRLSGEESKANRPVRIEGIVTYYDPRTVLFVQDQTAGVFVYHTGAPLALRPGQAVRVTGVASSGIYSPFIDAPVIDTLETSSRITPRAVSLAQIEFGGLDAQLVELTGVVRAHGTSENRLNLELVDPPHRISIWIAGDQDQKQIPVDGSLVRVQGVVGIGATDKKQLAGFQLFVNTLHDITVLHEPSADPFGSPAYRIGDLKTHSARTRVSGLVRIRGVVTLCRAKQMVFVQDSTGGVEVRTQGPFGDLAPGTLVEAAGYLGPILGASLLEDAVIRKLGTAATQQPMRLAPEELFLRSGDCQLIQIEAYLLDRLNTSSNSTELVLKAGNCALNALIETARPEETFTTLKPGSRLRVTGVSKGPSGSLGANSALTLFLRSPADIELLSPPLAPPRLGLQAFAAAAILTSIALGLAMIFILKQRRETERLLQLQTTLQAEMLQGEQQLRRAMEERARIARDLHDDIIQSIYAVGLSLEGCRRAGGEAREQIDQRLAAAIHALNTTIRSVRGFIAGLEPKVLNGREFKTALKSLALTSGDASTQFDIEVDPAAANALTSTQATQLLHIAKEAMSNSLRHARASRVSVSLGLAGTGTRLEILDDGAGFNPRADSGPGHGLRNMSARSREINSDLQIISSSGRGCRIVVTIPTAQHHEPD